MPNKKLSSTKPHFKDFRTTKDGVTVADMGFKRQLKALDPELDTVWDWASNKWEIWRFPGQTGKKYKKMNHKARHMMTVQTKDRTFRELGADILLTLQKGDPLRYSLNELCAYFDAIDDNLHRAKRKTFEDYIESVTKDTEKYIHCLTGHVPKAFEKVKIKRSDQKFLLDIPTKRLGVKIFKPRPSQIIANAVGGCNA